MVSRVSHRRWFLRDLPQTAIVLGCAVFIVGLLIYAIDWSSLRQDTTVRRQPNGGNGEQPYTGSIILPMRGKLCWEGLFDNRTGRMIDKGNVNCDEATHHLAEKDQPAVTHLRAVGKAFRRQSD